MVPSPTVYTQLGEAVQAQLAEVGITLNIQMTEPAQLGQAMYIDKTAAFALLYTNGSIDPANTVGSRFASTGFFNAGKYSTPHLEDLYQQALATTDDEARTDVMQQISDRDRRAGAGHAAVLRPRAARRERPSRRVRGVHHRSSRVPGRRRHAVTGAIGDVSDLR